MILYITKRMLLAVPTLLGITILVFIAVRLAPGDTAQALAGLGADKEFLDAIRREYGLDRPLYEQFGRYVENLLKLDLGQASSTRVPVAEELAAAFPITLTLALGGTAWAVIGGVTLGALAARFQRTWIDYTVMMIALVGLSVPNYVLGLFLIILFAVNMGILPATGASSPVDFILPIFTVGLVGLGVLARQTRSAILEVLNEDYLRTARAKGLRERTVLVRHALRNALMPVLTTVGLIFGELLGGAVIVEAVFGMPGVGKYMVDRIATRDYAAVQGGVLLIAYCYVLVNVLVDVLYGVVDKRVTLK